MTATDIAKLTELVERGFAAVAYDIQNVRDELSDLRSEMTTGFAGIRAEISDIRETMATKEDVKELRAELREINMRLDNLEEAVGGMRGYAKEIDGLRTRLAAVEKHLGLNRTLTA